MARNNHRQRRPHAEEGALAEQNTKLVANRSYNKQPADDKSIHDALPLRAGGGKGGVADRSIREGEELAGGVFGNPFEKEAEDINSGDVSADRNAGEDAADDDGGTINLSNRLKEARIARLEADKEAATAAHSLVTIAAAAAAGGKYAAVGLRTIIV